MESCHSCHGERSAPGSRPHKCFNCSGTGEIKSKSQSYLANIFTHKKCNQCKGIGYIIKNPCKECDGKGSKVYTVEEVIPIPRGIKTDTNIRIEKKVKIFFY